MSDGFSLGSWKGVPIRIHWTAGIAALVFTRFNYAPAAWIAFAFLILGHELGHAHMVRRYGGAVIAINLNGFGGQCYWTGHVTPIQRANIAWGGVLAQLLIFVAAAFAVLPGWPRTGPAADALLVFTESNFYLAAFNLLPIAPLDGAQAWQTTPHFMRRASRIFRSQQRAFGRHADPRRHERNNLRVVPGGADRNLDEQVDDIFARARQTPLQSESPRLSGSTDRAGASTEEK